MSENQAKSHSKDQKKRKIFVGGIAKTVTNFMLKQYFSKFGKVERAVVNKEHYTDKSRGSGFVLFCSFKSAQLALNFAQPHVLEGKQFDCQPCLLRDEIKQIKSSQKSSRQRDFESPTLCVQQFPREERERPSRYLETREPRANWNCDQVYSPPRMRNPPMSYDQRVQRQRHQRHQRHENQFDGFGRPCYNPHYVTNGIHQERRDSFALQPSRNSPKFFRNERPAPHYARISRPMLNLSARPLARTGLIVKTSRAERYSNRDHYHNYVLNYGPRAKLPGGYSYSDSEETRSSWHVTGDESAPTFEGFEDELSWERERSLCFDGKEKFEGTRGLIRKRKRAKRTTRTRVNLDRNTIFEGGLDRRLNSCTL